MSKNIKSPLSGSFINWESEALQLLNHYEYDFGSRLPKGDLVSRGMEKLSRVVLADSKHLRVLLPRIVRQVLIDAGRRKSREEARFVQIELAKIPSTPTHLPELLSERLEWLLGPQSPLDPLDKALVQAAVEDPARCIRSTGELDQSELAERFNVVPSAIHYRWKRILEKVATANPPAMEVE